MKYKLLNLNLRRKNIASTRVFTGIVLKIKIFSHLLMETSRSTKTEPFIILCAVVLENQYPKWVYILSNSVSKLLIC